MKASSLILPPQKRSIQKDLAGLEKHLSSLFDDYLPSSTHLNAINMACGRADETAVLGKLLTQRSDTAQLLGVDIRETEIQNSNTFWKKPLESLYPHLGINFRVGNGKDATLQPEGADLFFVRHQNLWFDPAGWQRLYHNALNQLSEQGILVITSYFDREHAAAREVIKSQGAIELKHLRNQDSRHLIKDPKTVKSVDRHISVFKKP